MALSVESARRTAVHRSLLEIKTIAGVEDRLAIANGTIAAALVLGLGLFAYLALAVALHLILARVTREDPCARRAYLRYCRQADLYDPWPRVRTRQGQRPDGLGRGMLC